MGRDEILNKISKGARASVILGFIFAIGGLIVSILMFIMGTNSDNVVFLIIMLALFAVGVVILIFNIPQMLDPMKSKFIRKNPDILKMADELYSNIVYQDKTLMFSPRIIANACDIRQMAYTDEVFLIYVYIHKTNGVTDLKQLRLETARETINLPIIYKKDDEINSLIGQILQHCRYARVGYNDDGMAYLRQMRELWKQDQARKHMRLN